jgi:RHS repeat-associated protein
VVLALDRQWVHSSYRHGSERRIGIRRAIVADLNGDGLADIARRDTSAGNAWKLRLHAGVKPDLLDQATDGFGNFVNFDYVSLVQGNYSKYSDAVYPEQDYQGPRYVVSQYSASNGAGGTYTQSFWYWGARVHLQGRGLEGFYAQRSSDSRNGLYDYEYFNRSFPLTGTVFQSDLLQPNGSTLISRVQNSWTALSYGSGYDTRSFPYVSQSTVTRYELGGTYNGNLLTTSVTTNTVDSTSGTIYDTTTTTTEASTGNGINAGQSYTQRTYHSSLFTDTSVNWCLGRPATTQQINSHTLYGGTSLTRQFDTSWDGAYCRATQVIAQYGDPQWQVTTALGYDSFGNVNSRTVTGVGMSGRTTQTNWGTTRQLPVSVTNALSQTTQIGWDYTLGIPTSETDPNGIAVSWQYDNFGRRTRENRADSTATTWSYNDCASYGCVNSNNKLLIIATQLNTSGGFVSDQWTYLDKLDRPLVTRALTLSGAYSRVDREYDALGRVYRESAPCWWSSCTYYWTTHSYDLLNRRTATSRPVGDSDPTLQTSYVYYEGLSIRTVDPQSKQSTKIASAIGQLARSADHDGYYQTFDYDAFSNPVRVTDSTGNTLQSSTYGITGALLTRTDTDLGAWTYAPNPLGEVEHIRDAKTTAPAWTTNMTYDALGRMTTRQDVPEAVTSTWTWGTSAVAKNIGRLASLSGNGYSESYSYDSIGRPQTTTITSDATYQIDYAYNGIGALDTLTYPTSTSGYRLKVQYDYQNGLPLRVKDFNAPSTVFWLANATDPRGNLIDETLGNGLRTIRGFDLVTGRIDYVQTGPGGGSSIQNLSYTWDKVGNLTQRQDARQGLTEAFYYDNLYRLDYSTLNGTTNRDFSYDALGNVTYNSDVGTYTYHPTKKHAVATAGPYTISYDNNGNVTSDGAGGTASWYSYNLPNTISGPGSSGTGTSQTWYGPERNRWKQVATASGITETTFYVGGLLEKVTLLGVTSWKHYITAPSGPVALYARRSDGTQSTSYFTSDHLGSADSITDASGAVQVRLSYHAFGKRRKEAGWSGSVTSSEWLAITNTSRHGFTFHEMLDTVGMVHMNGRIYSPTIGRFLSPDPFVPHPDSTQSFNRYSYVENGPLSRIDPTGFMEEVVVSARIGPLGGGGTPGSGGGGGGSLERGGDRARGGDDSDLQEVVVVGTRPTNPPPAPVPPVLVQIPVNPANLGGRDGQERQCSDQAMPKQRTVGECWAACMDERLSGAADFLGNALGINSLALLVNAPVSIGAGGVTATARLGTYTGGIIGRAVAGVAGRSVGVAVGAGASTGLALAGAALGGYALGTAGDCAVRCTASGGAEY